MRSSTLLLICLMYCSAAQAETIHRCVDAAGKVSYSATPCTPGSSQVKSFETKTAPTSPQPSDAMPYGNGRPDYKDQARAFQRRHAARQQREQYEEYAEARRRRDDEETRQRKENHEKYQQLRNEEMYGRTDDNRYERYVKEKKYLKPAQ